MSLKFSPESKALSYDPTACFIAGTGLDKADLAALAPKLKAAKDEVLAEAKLWAEQGNDAANKAQPADKQPLDAGFMDLPDRLLADYKKDRKGSELGHILRVAERLRESVDKIVVLGIGGSYMGARALFEACCHPYHNELPRGARGGKPRIYFEGNNVDNDATQGLLDLLGCNTPGAKQGKTPEERWGIIVISKSGGTLETAAAFRLFWTKLLDSVGGDKKQLAELIVPVTGASGKLFELSKALGLPDVFDIPDGVGGRFSILTAVGLLPAAVIGIDIVRLLEGAAAMNKRFRDEGPFTNTTPLGSNPVLDYVGVCHLLEEQRGLTTRLLSTWGKGLEAAGFWYDQLLSESLGKHEKGATPLTVVNTRGPSLARPATSRRPPRQTRHQRHLPHEPPRSPEHRKERPRPGQAQRTRRQEHARDPHRGDPRHQPSLRRRQTPDGRSAPARAGRIHDGPVLPNADAHDHRRRPPHRNQPLRPTGRRRVQEAHAGVSAESRIKLSVVGYQFSVVDQNN